jgi:hypothetical protein
LVWFVLGFLGMFVVSTVVGHRTNPASRYVPAIVAVGVAGGSTLYSVVVLHDSRAGDQFLLVAGIFVALVGMSAAMTFATDRRWLVSTPARRRLRTSVICVWAIWSVIEVVFQIRMPLASAVLTIGMLTTMFWPARKAPAPC